MDSALPLSHQARQATWTSIHALNAGDTAPFLNLLAADALLQSMGFGDIQSLSSALSSYAPHHLVQFLGRLLALRPHQPEFVKDLAAAPSFWGDVECAAHLLAAGHATGVHVRVQELGIYTLMQALVDGRATQDLESFLVEQWRAHPQPIHQVVQALRFAYESAAELDPDDAQLPARRQGVARIMRALVSSGIDLEAPISASSPQLDAYSASQARALGGFISAMDMACAASSTGWHADLAVEGLCAAGVDFSRVFLHRPALPARLLSEYPVLRQAALGAVAQQCGEASSGAHTRPAPRPPKL